MADSPDDNRRSRSLRHILLLRRFSLFTSPHYLHRSLPDVHHDTDDDAAHDVLRVRFYIALRHAGCLMMELTSFLPYFQASCCPR